MHVPTKLFIRNKWLKLPWGPLHGWTEKRRQLQLAGVGVLGRETADPLAQFSSVPQSCPTLCNPRDCSTLGLPVHHQLPEFTQTHAQTQAIQPSHPPSSPSPPAFNLSQHQGLFQ